MQVLAMQRRMRQARLGMPATLVERFESATSHVLQVTALSRVEREALPLLAEAGLVDWTGDHDKFVGLTAKGRQLLAQRGTNSRAVGKVMDRVQVKKRVPKARRHMRSTGTTKKDLQRAFIYGGGI